MEKIDIAALLYQAADRIRAAEEILAQPNCNDCGRRGMCKYEPRAGETVRANCPHWLAEKSKKVRIVIE